MSRLRVVHRTGFDYGESATASYNEARMLPQSTQTQLVVHAELDISPTASQHSYIDHWGTRVSTFEVLTPHRQLTVTATSVVDVRPIASRRRTLSREELAGKIEHSVDLADCVTQTPATAPAEEVRLLAEGIFETSDDLDTGARDICRAIGEIVAYVPGVTGVHSTARDAWQERRGVCQDIAHITLGALRSVGIPARYVSGYLHPDPEAPIGKTVAGESHAWIEWFVGEWRGYDPTNLIDVGERHVYVGNGRDYSDVPPLRGVYAGPNGSDLFVTVELTRLE